MLDDVAHVEAVAIIRALLEAPNESLPRQAAQQWLAENHPSPTAYMAALAGLQEDH